MVPLVQYDRDWINAWTFSIGAWWISWSPFIGSFHCQISKGRSIRQFLSIVLAPTVLSFLWFSTFGTLSTHVQSLGNVDLTQFPEVSRPCFNLQSTAILVFIASVVAIILIITFFITSADSATYVLAMLSDDGNLKPINLHFWAYSLRLLPSSYFFQGLSGLAKIRDLSLAFPPLIMVLIMVSLVIGVTRKKDKMGLSITPDDTKKINPSNLMKNK